MAATVNIDLKIGDRFMVEEYLISKNRCGFLDLDVLLVQDIQNGEVITTIANEDANGIPKSISAFWDIAEFQTLIRLGFVKRVQERQI